mmetsp:Transcript_5711/g.10817  ORF Transcript_5711/g.10817 Transcript_5711/m.10817 type:complete len:130 (+) Transcript_5711:135-524(+)
MRGKEVLIITILLNISPFTTGFTLNSCPRPFNKEVVVSGLQMAGAKDEEELEMVDASNKFKSSDNGSTQKQQAKNLVRNVEVEQKWRDNEIAANTTFDLTNLSSLFILIPGIFLLNDFFHFLPSEWNLL